MSSIGWGIIGVPDGFQHISEGYTVNKNISIVDQRICHEDFASHPIYAVIFDTVVVNKNDSQAKERIVYFAEYKFACEIERSRKGSYYGSYLAISGSYPNSVNAFEEIINFLDLWTKYNEKQFLQNRRFISNFPSHIELPNASSTNATLSEVILGSDSLSAPLKGFKQKQAVIVNSDKPEDVFLAVKELGDEYSIVYCVADLQYFNLVANENSFLKKTIDELKQESRNVIQKREKEKAEELERQRLKELQAKLELDSQLQEINEFSRSSEKDFESLREIYKALLAEKKVNEEATLRGGDGQYSNKSEEELAQILKLNNVALGLADNVIKTIQSESTKIQSLISNVPLSGERLTHIENGGYSSTATAKNKYTHVNHSEGIEDISTRKRKIFIAIGSIFVLTIVISLLVVTYYFSQKNAISNSIVSGSELVQSAPNDLEIEKSISPPTDEEINNVTSDSLLNPALTSFDSCQHEGEYIVTNNDVSNDTEQLRSDEEIINQVINSILEQENTTLDEQKREQFRKTLISCNTSLDTSKLHEPTIERLPITPGTKIKYALIK